jgi:hypothetical protein
MRRVSSNTALNPKKALAYFQIHFNAEQIEYDLENIDAIRDPAKLEVLASFDTSFRRAMLSLEHDTVAALSRLFGSRVMVDGRDSSGTNNLECYVLVDSYDDVENLYRISKGRRINTGNPYSVVEHFVFYPQGNSGFKPAAFSFHGSLPNMGTVEQWLKDNDPRARRAARVRDYFGMD